ncbi:MAG: hypothetical protein R3F31_19255 [Verrucomicrobiales bacterium]
MTLYQNVELNLRRPGVFELIFTIHAPELVGQPDTGEAGAAWLSRLSDADLESLVAKARLWLPTQVGVLLNGQPLAVDSFSVESLTLLRSASSSGETPAGCFLASLALPLPEEPSELKIVYANDVPKRLLLTVSRPKPFLNRGISGQGLDGFLAGGTGQTSGERDQLGIGSADWLLSWASAAEATSRAFSLKSEQISLCPRV